MDTIRAIETRSSARSYAATPLPAKEIDMLVQAAQSAPKAGVFHITVISNPELLKEINDKALKAMQLSGNDFLVSRAALPGYMPLYGAPLLMLFSAPQESAYGIATCACAATAAAIAASGMELGSCYVVTPTLALTIDPELNGRLQLPAGYQGVCGLLAGYKDGEKYATPKSPQDNVTHLK